MNKLSAIVYYKTNHMVNRSMELGQGTLTDGQGFMQWVNG